MQPKWDIDSGDGEGSLKAGKKRKRDEVDGTRSKEGTKQAELKIKPGESLAHFRRYVSARPFSRIKEVVC